MCKYLGPVDYSKIYKLNPLKNSYKVLELQLSVPKSHILIIQSPPLSSCLKPFRSFLYRSVYIFSINFIKTVEGLPLSILLLTKLSPLAPILCISLAVAHGAGHSPHLSSLHDSTQKALQVPASKLMLHKGHSNSSVGGEGNVPCDAFPRC